jgi:hypothetical protein
MNRIEPRRRAGIAAAVTAGWVLAALLGAGATAGAADPGVIRASIDPRTCRLLEQHVPAPDVAYVPGVDASGHPVVPADLTPPPEVPGRFRFELSVDPFDYRSSRDLAWIDRRIAALPKVSPERDLLLARRERILREREVSGAGFEDTHLSAGTVEVDTSTGQVLYEGQVLSPPDRDALILACRARAR